MNNQQMAIDATTTAYNSQGSAMREQQQYMQSYEYQMNVMSATATDLALTMENALVGDAFYLVISGLTSLMDITIEVVDRFGLLAPIMGIAGIAFAKFGGGTALVVTQMTKLWTIFKANGLIGSIQLFGGKLLALASSSKIANISLTTLKVSMQKLFASTIVGAGFVAVGWAIEKLIGHFADAKRASEEAEESVKNALDAYNAQGQDISGLVDRYEELNKAMRNNADALSVDEQREYGEIVGQIQTMLPASVDYIDAQGQAHLRSADYIREQVGAMDELAQRNAELAVSGNSEEMQEQIENIQDITDRISKYQDQVDNFGTTVSETYAEFSKRMEDMDADASVISEAQFNRIKDAEGMQTAYTKSASELINNQFLLSEAIQETTVMVGQQIITLMQSNGQMENISSAGEAMIRNFASNNSSILENAEDADEAMNILYERSKDFGLIAEDIYTSITSGLNEVDSTKAVESMDNLLQSVPNEFWEQSMGDMQSSMQALGSVVSEVSTNADLDVDKLVGTLEAVGIESGVAREIAITLGTEFNNQAINVAVAQDELAEYNDELGRTKEYALEAIDPLEQLFGISSEDTKNIESHVAGLQILRQQYGDTWAEMDRAEPSIQNLAKYFGQSEEFIRQNIDEVGLAVRTISQAKQEWDEETKSYKLKFDDDVDKSTKKLVMSFLESGDSYKGFAGEFASNTGVVTKKGKELETMTEDLNNSFKNFFENPDDENTYEVLLGTLNEQLKGLEGTFALAGDKANGFKLVMADGTESEYLDNLNQQIEDSGQKLVYVQDEYGNLEMQLGTEGGEARSLWGLSNSAQNGMLAIQELETQFGNFVNGKLNEEQESTFFNILQNQVDLFGEGILGVTEGTNGLKLEIDEGSPNSDWLEAFSNQIENGKVQVEETTNNLGELGFELSTKSGDVFFTSFATDAENAKKKIDETNESKDKLDENLNKNATIMNLDTSSAERKIREVEEDVQALGETPPSIDIDATNAEGSIIDIRTGIDALDEKPVLMGMDTTVVSEQLDGVKTDIEGISDNEVNLKMSEDTMKNNNDVVESLVNTRAEVNKVDEILANLNAELAVAGDGVGTIMNNVKGITDMRNAVTKLKDDLDASIEKLTQLYKGMQNTNIDTSGLTNSASEIEGAVSSVSRSIGKLVNSVSVVNSSISNMRFDFDVTPVLNFTQVTSGVLMSTLNQFRAFSRGVSDNLSQVESSYMNNIGTVERFRNALDMNLSLIMQSHRIMGTNVVEQIQRMGTQATSSYTDTILRILNLTRSLQQSMEGNMARMSATTSLAFRLMGTNMKNIFSSAVDDIASSAGTIPSKIGKAIRDNMAQSSGAMDSLANNMIRRFKTTLGIHSPSRVFQELGGFVMQGLVNGLSDSNITDLGQNVFSEFSNNAISSLDQIKGYMSFEPTTSGSFGAGFRRTSGFGPRKSPGGIGSTNHRGVDYAAPAGTPIKSNVSGTVVANGYNGVRGNYITVRSGNATHTYQHNSSNNVAVGQKIGKGQVLGTVGSTGASTGAHLHYEVNINGRYVDPEKALKGFRGFANGGFVDKKELAWHGEEGLEAIIPLTSSRKDRGLDLWEETGGILGMNEDLLKMLTKVQRTASSSNTASFGAMDGGSGEGSSDGGGTSGDIKPDFSGIMRSIAPVSEQPMFGAMDNKKELDDLFKRDMNSVNMERRNAMLTKSNTMLSALTKQTISYRNALEEVNRQERLLTKETEKQLKQTVKRQSTIEKELSKLSNTGRHTEAQRKKYNELQEEFDKNTKSIYSMENEISKLNQSMDERKLEMYTDFLGQITSKYDGFTESIGRTISNLEYSAELMELQEPDNVGKQLDNQYKILKETTRLQNTFKNSMNTLQKEYDKASTNYGKNSKQAQSAQEALWKAQGDYQKSVLDTIKLENSIEDTRKSVADESIKSLKDYYKQTQSMTEKALETEKKSLEKSHENKMSMYDEEIAKIKSVYDERMNEMDEEREQEEYQEKMNELNQQRIDLMNQISRASRDNSLEGRKRLAEYQEELAGVNSEITESQKERQDTLYKRELEAQRDAQVQAVEERQKRADEEHKIALESLDNEAEITKKLSEERINDEAMWDKIRNDFASGNTNGLVKLMEEMEDGMAQFLSGNFGNISLGFEGLSDEDKKLFNEDVLLEISNLMFDASKNIEQFNSTANSAVREIGNVAGKGYGSQQMTDGKTVKATTQANTTPTIKAPSKPKPKPKQDNRHHTIKKGDTLWDLAQRYYGNPYEWNRIAQANENPDPRKLQIGRKMLIPFDTGGLKIVHVKNFELLEIPKAS